MTRRTIRDLLRPLLREAAGVAASSLLDPCTRLVWWSVLRARWRSKGRDVLAAFAGRRAEVLTRRCRRLADGHCDIDRLVWPVINRATVGLDD